VLARHPEIAGADRFHLVAEAAQRTRHGSRRRHRGHDRDKECREDERDEQHLAPPDTARDVRLPLRDTLVGGVAERLQRGADPVDVGRRRLEIARRIGFSTDHVVRVRDGDPHLHRALDLPDLLELAPLLG
jgi:hypothetical protein